MISNTKTVEVNSMVSESMIKTKNRVNSQDNTLKETFRDNVWKIKRHIGQGKRVGTHLYPSFPVFPPKFDDMVEISPIKRLLYPTTALRGVGATYLYNAP